MEYYEISNAEFSNFVVLCFVDETSTPKERAITSLSFQLSMICNLSVKLLSSMPVGPYVVDTLSVKHLFIIFIRNEVKLIGRNEFAIFVFFSGFEMKTTFTVLHEHGKYRNATFVLSICSIQVSRILSQTGEFFWTTPIGPPALSGQISPPFI